MNYRILGNTGLEVSEIGFGTWAIGGDWGDTDDNESISALQRAFDLGINFYDTADIYGNGRSEILLSRAFGHRTDDVVIATKGGRDFYTGNGRKRWDKKYIEFALDKSLERLRRNAIDIYQLHNPPIDILDDMFPFLDYLVQKGKIRNYGISITSAEEGSQILSIKSDLILQLTYNLQDRRAKNQLLSKVENSRMGIIIRTPLNHGLLSGKYKEDGDFPSDDHRNSRGKKWLYEGISVANKFRFLMRDGHRTMSQAALAFVLSESSVSSVIPGMRSCRQVEENIGTIDKPLSSEEIDNIEIIR